MGKSRVENRSLTCLPRNLYAGQEATVRTGHGTADWFQIGKGVYQGFILSPHLFNLYAEYIMRNPGLDESQTGIKMAGININNFRYFFYGSGHSKSLQIVIAAMKLTDACSLEEKL